MTRDAALAWIRAHETDSNEQAAQALLALIDDETRELRAHYMKALASEEGEGDPAPFAPGGPLE